MPDLVARCSGTLGGPLTISGDWDQALNSERRATEIVRTLDAASPSRAEGSAQLQGRIYLARGKAQAAKECLHAAIQQSQDPNSRFVLLQANAALAEADLLRTDAAAALVRLEPLLDRAGCYEQSDTDVVPLIAWACLELGEVERVAAMLAGA